jgi:hypothetical protein
MGHGLLDAGRGCGEIRAHRQEGLDEALPIGVRNPRQSFAARFRTDRSHLAEDRMRLVGQVEQAQTPVGRVVPPLDQPGRLKAIQDTDQRNRLEFEDLGEGP